MVNYFFWHNGLPAASTGPFYVHILKGKVIYPFNTAAASFHLIDNLCSAELPNKAFICGRMQRWKAYTGSIFLPAAKHAGLHVHFVLPSSSSFLGIKGFFMHFGARKALEHGLLGPLSSELRSEMTSEATGSLRGHFQRNSHSNGRSS